MVRLYILYSFSNQIGNHDCPAEEPSDPSTLLHANKEACQTEFVLKFNEWIEQAGFSQVLLVARYVDLLT